jgi:hypothetical protein
MGAGTVRTARVPLDDASIRDAERIVVAEARHVE